MNRVTPGRDQENHGHGPRWIKSSLSFSNGNCVEVAHLPDDHIGVRDSKHPDGPVLQFTPDEWSAFLGGARNGEFDGFGKELSARTRRLAVLASSSASAVSGEGPSRSRGTFALLHPRRHRPGHDLSAPRSECHTSGGHWCPGG
jgi:hypothetical protein